jgi:uncharacterized protein YndB with AHSA1/START domain
MRKWNAHTAKTDFYFFIQEKKMGKKILIGLAVLFGAFVVLSLVAPKEMLVEREIVINTPQSKVYNYLLSVENQKAWSPWYKMDPDMKTETEGEDGEVGFVQRWEGNKDVGVGEQEIIKLTRNERIDTKLRFKEPMVGEADAWFITEKVDNQTTKVKWGMYSVSEFPMNVFCFVFNALTNMMNKTFDQGLADLKVELEK